MASSSGSGLHGFHPRSSQTSVGVRIPDGESKTQNPEPYPETLIPWVCPGAQESAFLTTTSPTPRPVVLVLEMHGPPFTMALRCPQRKKSTDNSLLLSSLRIRGRVGGGERDLYSCRAPQERRNGPLRELTEWFHKHVQH